MAAPRKPAIDKMVDLYMEMSLEERRVVVPVIRGIERAMKVKPATPEEQAAFEELGERTAEEVAL